jgi:hypothetical protein
LLYEVTHFNLNSGASWYRFVTVGLLCFLMGVNVAFIIWAGQLFPIQTCKFWRVFFVGKSVLTMVIIIDLWARHGPITWRTPTVTVGALIAVWAMYIIWRDRPYRGIPPAAVEPSSEKAKLVIEGFIKPKEEKGKSE